MSRLLNAVFANDLEKIASLLDRDPDPIKDTETLCQAIGWGRGDATMLLIQRGANLNIKDRNGNHPLNMACHSSAIHLFDELVRAGSDPRLAPGLVTDAAWGGRVDVLQYLHSAGFDLNERNRRDIRPLDAAIGMGHLDVVEYLLSKNVDTLDIEVAKPLAAWKGALPRPDAMAQIRALIIKKRAESHHAL